MFDRNQNFEESEELKEIDDSAEDGANDSVDFAEPPLEKEVGPSVSRNGLGRGLPARKMLEEYREELALRKAIYDDLYGFEEEE
ncbi:MAG: hypothetical protein ACWGOV_06990 [Acidiferrobacterales bacterium]